MPERAAYHDLQRSPHSAPAIPGCHNYTSANNFRFMVVRNPYSRLLSGYLDKCILQGNLCPVDVSLARKNPVSGFAQLVAHIRSGANLNSHFTLLTQHCGIQDGYDYYLPTEQMDLWYSPFSNLTGLTQALRFGWNMTTHWWSGKSECFYQVRGHDCDGHSSDGVLGGVGHSFHASSADSQLDVFFNPSLARAVTNWAEPDLAEFGYRPWGGVNGLAYLRSISARL